MHRELGLVDGQDLNGLHEQAITKQSLTAWLTVHLNVRDIDRLVINTKVLCTIEESGRLGHDCPPIRGPGDGESGGIEGMRGGCGRTASVLPREHHEGCLVSRQIYVNMP
jgi:hypothetical protein